MSPTPPPPAFIQKDIYSAADSARKRLVPKSRFPHFLSLPNLRSSKQTLPESPVEETPSQDTSSQLLQVGDLNLIHLDASRLDHEEEYKDKYEWAIVYENQRG
jgi:hypothetical protein